MNKQPVNILFPSYCLAYGSRLYLLDTTQAYSRETITNFLTHLFVSHIAIMASCCMNMN